MKPQSGVKAGLLNDNAIGVSLVSVTACDSLNFVDSVHVF